MLCCGLVVCLHEVGKETSDPRPLGRGHLVYVCFIRLEDYGLSAMLCCGLEVFLHEVVKETSNLRHVGPGIHFLFVSLDLRIMGSWPCYVVGWKYFYMRL